MTLYKIIIMYLLSYAIDIAIAQSGYDTLDPWGDPPHIQTESTNPKQKLNIFDLDFPSEKSPKNEQDLTYTEILSYYKRLVKLIFRRTAFKPDRDASNEYVRNIHLRVNDDQFTHILGSIATSDDLRKIDGIITNIFSNSSEGFSEKIFDIMEEWSYSFSIFMEKPHAKIILMLSFLISLIIYFKFVSKSSTFKITMMLLLITSYCWTYYEMYMEEEVKRVMLLKEHPIPPKECETQSMTIIEIYTYQLRKLFTSDPCKDYYMLTSKTTFEVVNPAIVAVETFTRLIFQPVTTGGQKLGEGLSLLFNSIPWPWRLFLFPVALVFFFLIIIIFASCGLGINVNLNVFYNLFSFSISPTNSKESSPVKMDERALGEAKILSLSNVDLKYIEKVSQECEKILKSRERVENMIEYKKSESDVKVETHNSPVKNKRILKISVNDDDQNTENVDTTNCLKPNMKENENDIKLDKSAESPKMKTLKGLIRNVNEMEDRLEQANQSINDKLTEIKAAENKEC